MTAPHDDYATRQSRMDAEYVEAGGDAPNHQRQFPQVFRGAPVDDVVQPEVYRADDEPEPIELSRGDSWGQVGVSAGLGAGVGAATGIIGPTISEGLSGSEIDNFFADNLGLAASTVAGAGTDLVFNLFKTACEQQQ